MYIGMHGAASCHNWKMYFRLRMRSRHLEQGGRTGPIWWHGRSPRYSACNRATNYNDYSSPKTSPGTYLVLHSQTASWCHRSGGRIWHITYMPFLCSAQAFLDSWGMVIDDVMANLTPCNALPGEIWQGVDRNSERFDQTTYTEPWRRVNRLNMMCMSRCGVDITIQRLTHTHRLRSPRIVLKWCSVTASILRVFVSNHSLFKSTPCHISPGRALQGAKFVYNNYIHGHYIINYHSSAIQECVGDAWNGFFPTDDVSL